MQTKDGYLMIGAAGESIWERCAAALGHPEWCEDPRFATNQQRMKNRAALETEMERVFADEYHRALGRRARSGRRALRPGL